MFRTGVLLQGAAAFLAILRTSSALPSSSASFSTSDSPLEYDCVNSVLPVTVAATNLVLNLSTPQNQEQLTDFFTRLTSETSNVTSEVFTNLTSVNQKTYKIFTKLCIPALQDERKTVELLAHGVTGDHSYWKFDGAGSKYNYAEAALKSGHAVLSWDGIQEVQTATEVEILAQLVAYLKSNPRGNQFGRFIGVGHSYGSEQLTWIAGKYPDILDGIVLTGYTPYSGSFETAIGAFAWTLAAKQNPKRFGALSNSYIIPANGVAYQETFFRYGNFDSGVFKRATASMEVATLGEIVTQAPPPAKNFTKPVLVVVGAKDYIFCGGNCYQTGDEGKVQNLLVLAKGLFPDLPEADFETYVPEEVGHAVNLHLNAQETFAKIQDWIRRA